MPMLERVVETLHRAPAIEHIGISTDAPELVVNTGGLGTRLASRQFELLPSESSPSASVLAAMASRTVDRPLLLTTADHALLDDGMLEYFLSAAENGDADLAVGVVAEHVIRRKFPESKRTYLPFRGHRYSGANLFALRTPKARRVVEFWRRVEAHRKQPWRLVRAFGLGSLLLFGLRRLDLDAALVRASRTLRAKVCAVPMPQAEAALDVDRLADYEQAVRILEQRRTSGQSTAVSAP